MAKHITLFDTQEQYNAFRDSSDYVYPNISYVREAGSVINKNPAMQTKEIDIVENGEIEVKPDAGFAYLSAVKVKTNVAQSGGGSNGGMRYFDVRPMSNTNKSNAVSIAYLLKLENPDKRLIAPYYTIENLLQISIDLVDITEISCMPVPYVLPDGSTLLSEQLIERIIQLGAIEITEEEFYNLA